MTSQLDLDQGGTFREWTKVYLGPSVGHVWVPNRSQLLITAAGTYTLDFSTTYVQVSIAGAVTIILPPLTGALTVPPIALPGRSVKTPISIVDVGGFAAANPITIQPSSPSDTIFGLTQIQIANAFGGFILYPNVATWTNQE